jgi:hypothetical protein
MSNREMRKAAGKAGRRFLQQAVREAREGKIMSDPRENQTLFIDTSSSSCGACGRGADPYELRHDTILSYGGTAEGCHAEWRYLSSNYTNVEGLHDAIQEMRPDLEWIGALPQTTP